MFKNHSILTKTNFVAFLAAIHSNDSLLLYSTYLNMFLYTNRNVGRVDTAAAKMAYKALIPQVKEDIATWQKFNASHQSFMEPIVRWGYGFYLKQNNQPQGLLSYDAVTHFLVLYYKITRVKLVHRNWIVRLQYRHFQVIF